MSRMRRAVSVLTAGVLALGISVTVGARDAGAVDASAPFTNVFNQNVNGAIISFGNSLLTCPDTAGDPCRQARAGAKWDNNSFRMVNLDADGDSSTFNSSRSDLVLPDGAQVLFAHLYWGARLTAGTTTGETHPGDPTLAHKMKLKVPGASAYTDIDGRLIAQNNGQNGAYHAVYDVTDLVKAAGTGEYWGANVQAGTGLDRYAGWSITVAYSAPGLPLRNLTVYEGFNTVGSGSPQTVTVTDFLAPLDGLVDAQLSMVAYEGDLAQTSDYTQLNSTQLATAVSPGSNFFDSVNSLAGGYVETKYPAYQNMLGFDIKNLGISGAIKNGDTRAAFSFRTGGDVYYPGVLALAINLFAPDFTSSTKTAVNLSSSDGAFPGDTLQYTLTYTNTGQDRSEKTRSCDPLPAEVDYIPGSLYLLSAPAGTTTEQLPLLLPDDGSKFGVYSDGEVCVNLGVGAGRGGDAQAGGTLKVSDSTSYQFQVKIKAGAGGQTVRNIANLPYVTGTTGTPAIYYTPPVATPVGPKADVKIEKAMSADDPLPGQVGAIAGQPGTTTLTVTNDGPSVAEGVTVTDPLPTDYVATAVNWYANGDSGDCGLPALGGQVVCNLPNLANEAVAIISIKGYPKSESLATTLANTASVTTTTFDPNLSNNVDTVSLPMVHEADLKIAKTPTPQQVVPGQTVTWTLTVTNKCDRNTSPPSGCLSDAMGVTISDTVLDPTKLILTGASDAGGDLAMTCPASSFSASGFQCVAADAVGRLGPGQTAAVEVTGYLRAEATSGAFRNQAAVTSGTFDPDQTDNITTATVTPGTPNSIIALTKTGPATAVAGTRVDYTITAQNEGPSDASGVVVTDTLPQALTVDSLTKATSDRGGDCSIDGRVVTCDLGSLPGPAAPGGAGAIATIKITGALLPADAALDSTFTNSGVTVSCAAGTCAPDPDDPPSVTTTVETQADLAVAKTADQSHVPALDDEVTYTITVTNNGPSNAQAVVLEDAMPQDMTAVSATVAGGEPDACTIGPTDPNVSCALGELAVGASVQVQVVGRAGPNVPEGATQTAEVESGTDDPDDGNNSAKWVHSGSDQADLALTKTSSQDFVAGADSSYYTIRVRNNGPDQADDVVVTDVLPDGLTLTDPVTNTPLLPSECAYNADERQLTCQLGDLQMGRSWGVALYVKVANDLAEGQVLTNLAVAGSTTSDPTTDNNGDMTVDLVKTQTDVEIDYQILYPDPDADAENPCANATASPPPSGVYPPWDGPAYNGPGSLRCAVIEVKNMGLSNARNVKVRSNVVITALPDIPSLPPGCQAVNQEIVCDLNNVMADGLPAFPNGLEPGESMKFPFPFAISPGTDSPANYPDCGRAATCPGSAGGWASASTTTAEADTANNYDTAGLNITGALTYPQMTKRALTTIPNPNGDTHDTYIAGQKFGYEIEFWIPARYNETQELTYMVADAAEVTLTDTVPAGFTITQVNTSQGDCEFTDTVATCALGTVRASTDQDNPLTVRVYVYGSIAPDAVYEISDDGIGARNAAEAISTTADVRNDSSQVRAYARTDVIQQADLQVSKLADAPVAYAGSQVGYTITTINNGPSDSAGAKIEDTLPLGLAFDQANSSPGCRLDHTVDSGPDAGRQVVVCDLQAAGEDPGVIPATGSVNTRITALTDPRDLRPYWCPLHPNEEGQICDDVLPAYDRNPPGPAEYARDLTNHVEASASSTDANPGNNTAEVTTELLALADVAISGGVTTDTPSAGSDLVYTLAAFNNGPSSLDSPEVVVTLPKGFVFQELAGDYMTCVPTNNGQSGLEVVWTVTCTAFRATPTRDGLDTGFTVPGWIRVTIPEDAPAGEYTANAHTYSRYPVECASNPDPNAGTCESDYTNNRLALSVNVVQTADTSLTKTLVGPNPVVVGQEVVYELAVANAGPSVAADVIVSDAVPTGLTFVSGAVVGGEACQLPSPAPAPEPQPAVPEPTDVRPADAPQAAVRCPVGTLGPSQTATARLTFKVDRDFLDEPCNTALVGSAALDPDGDNNQDKRCSTAVVPDTDLGVKIVATADTVATGDQVTFNAQVINNGPHPATGAVVTFTLPSGLAEAAVTPVARSRPGALTPCAAAGLVFSCPIGDLAVGETIDYRIAGVAVGAAGDQLRVVADVTHDFTDTDPTNDESEADEEIAAPTPSPTSSAPAPTSPAPTAPTPSPTGTMPVTGSNSLGLAGLAALALLTGATLLGFAHRRRPSRP